MSAVTLQQYCLFGDFELFLCDVADLIRVSGGFSVLTVVGYKAHLSQRLLCVGFQVFALNCLQVEMCDF